MPRLSASISPAYLARVGITPPTAPHTPRQTRGQGVRAGSAAEEALSASLRALGIEHEREWAWGKLLDPPRRYRADVAIPGRRLLVESVGNAHAAGHEKLARDTERQQLATLAGFWVLPVTPAQALDGSAALIVQRWLKGER